MTLREKALKFATEAHGSINQKRKYGGQDYIVHPIAVAEIVASVTNDEEVIAAALLHDVLEDVAPHKPEFGLGVIKQEFGSYVAALVHDLTNQYTHEKFPQFNRAKRKEMENSRMTSIYFDAMTIKLADIIHNCTFTEGADGFLKVYRQEKLEQLKYLGRGNKDLYKRAEEVLIQ